MNIGMLCSHDVAMIDAEDTLQRAALAMRERHVGSLLVVTGGAQGREAVGIVTDRDLVIDAMAHGASATDTVVADLVRRAPVTVPATASIDEALGTMQKNGVRRLLVTTPEGGVAGIASLDDVLHALASRMVGVVAAIQGGLQREATARAARFPQELDSVRVPAGPAAGAVPAGLDA